MNIKILFSNLCKFEFYFLKYETRKRHDQQINSKNLDAALDDVLGF